MTVKLPYTSRSAACDAIVDLLDTANPTAAVLKIYDSSAGSPGSWDPNASAPSDGARLVTLTFGLPAFGAAANGVATANAITSGSIIKTGTAAGFRIERSGTLIMQGTVSGIGGGGDIQFDTSAFVNGGTATITSLTVTMPQP
jgi:hypothetical protein